jgi:hypothetical protein
MSIYNIFNSLHCSRLSVAVRVIPLSRRKHGFDPRWARQSNQTLI